MVQNKKEEGEQSQSVETSYVVLAQCDDMGAPFGM